ncbi:MULTISPECIES: IS701 family transposase [Streptomyces]|uniref:IS701 family transposase n=1 Tax=Streptomyces doudnae TaxID=3075536 RepID=A0ABD5EYX4_9ACTN|nr:MULTISPECIES: IS701 family transposase [unclassified Streptomyces]MDT0439515.1 IS701 family transposase [Streptomyces sp. DSM 41981]MYQ69252.1 IS701 family transposase [Streptomyces sp. SID4950]SCE52497.1 transposase, IS4 family [Streptomyces sp. SolWspMP-5a-2]
MSGDRAQILCWSRELEQLHGRFSHRFTRSEPRETALAYLRGLLAPLGRKNGWTLAEQAGHAAPDRIHRLLNRIEWDADGVLDDVRGYVVDHLGDRDAVLVVDDTDFLKKGARSAGVQRQYSSAAGRTENCQVGVFLAYVCRRGRTLIDRRLYLPTAWTDDRQRCRRAGIGDDTPFQTKLALAREMVRRAITDGVPFLWVTAGPAYGFSASWRLELEEADVFHVMATTRHETLVTRWAVDHPVRDLFDELPRDQWERRPYGDAHGGRTADWARVEIRPRHRADRTHWALARRSAGCPDDVSYYVVYCPARTGLDELIRVVDSRAALEECFRTARQECGLDDYQVRRYPGWHRHMTLAMAAHACLTVLRARQRSTKESQRIAGSADDRDPRESDT